jgi:hypothetical protein
MDFRNARHTSGLRPIETFYTEVLGLQVLGRFEGHAGYNGLFLGFKGLGWHLEFTESEAAPSHHADEDDLLVFYLNSNEELRAILADAHKRKASVRQSKNPYWQHNGVELTDPDGFGVILTVKEKHLLSSDALTQIALGNGLDTWGKLLDFVRALPYGRTANRIDLGLVLKERKGTCSSKHALLKMVADANGIKDVRLVLAMYKMSEANTGPMGGILSENGLDHVPEAHCYLKINGKRVDLTNPKASIGKIEDAILEELEIEPNQVGDFKLEYHQQFLKRWIMENNIEMDFEKVWRIREACIAALSKTPAHN